MTKDLDNFFDYIYENILGMHVEDKGRFAIRNTIDSMRHLSVENMRVAEQVARGLMFAASPPAPANRRPW